MYATGRLPLIGGLGLEKLGVRIGSKHEIMVREGTERRYDQI